MQGLHNQHQGFVLITAILLLSVLTLSGFMAFELSQFSYKTNHARLAQIKARHSSEDARLIAVEKLESILRNQASDLNESINVLSSRDELIAMKATILSESERYQKDGLIPFLEIVGDGTKSSVYIQEFPVEVVSSGAGLAQHMAYAGDGLGLGGSLSFAKYYEIRAKGVARLKDKELAFWSASDFRFVP